MQGEDIEQRVEAVLVKLQEAHQHQRAGEQMGDVEGQTAHHRLRDTNRSSVAKSPSISAAPRNSGTRNTRIFAIDVSNKASRNPPAASLPRNASTPNTKVFTVAAGPPMPQGANRHAISAT